MYSYGCSTIHRINLCLYSFNDFSFINRSDFAIKELSKIFRRILIVTNQYLEDYQKLAVIFKEELLKLEGILSINVALTSENQEVSPKKKMKKKLDARSPRPPTQKKTLNSMNK